MSADQSSQPKSDVPVIEIEQGGSAGMVLIIRSLIEAGINQSPQLASKIKGSVTLLATDHGLGITIRFKPGRVVLSGDADPKASVVIRAPLLTLGKLGEGGHAVRGLLKRQVRVKGALRHPLLLVRVKKLIGAAGGMDSLGR